MNSDILYNFIMLSETHHAVRYALAGLDESLSQRIYIYIFFPRMCSLGFKGEMEVIPLNHLSL